MGERQNVRVEYSIGDQPIYLYSHWDGGGPLDNKVAEAFDSAQGRDRWDDEAYMTRIIFERMIKDSLGSSTGYGIAPYSPDANYPDIVVKWTAESTQPTINGLDPETYIAEVNVVRVQADL